MTMPSDRRRTGQDAPTFQNLVGLLRCPGCAADLQHANGCFACPTCRKRYPIEDGVLEMTPESEGLSQAQVQEQEDWERNAAFYLSEARSPLFALLHAAKVRAYRLDREERRLVVLDLGAGTGYFSKAVASWGHVPVTLDFSEAMLRLGQRAYGVPLPVRCATPPLPFRDESLDAVVANGMLHHCKAQGSLAETVREIRRVLRPEGLLLVYDRNGAWLGRHLHHFVMAVKRRLERRRRFASSSSDSEPDFSETDLQTVLDAGFVVERRRYVSTLFTFMSIVATNTVEYLGARRLAELLRFVCWPAAAVAERVFPFRALTVEQCLRLRKR